MWVATPSKHSSHANQVRLIGGDFRRRRLHFPDAPGLRPTPDRVRETLFNWLGQDLTGMACLDAFAGSGALGFEAASRNASRVVMLESSRETVEVLKKNQEMLNARQVEIVQADAMSWMKRSQARFDLVLLDPPFNSGRRWRRSCSPRQAGCMWSRQPALPRRIGLSFTAKGLPGSPISHY